MPALGRARGLLARAAGHRENLTITALGADLLLPAVNEIYRE